MNDVLHTKVIAKVIKRYDKSACRRSEAIQDVLLLNDSGLERAKSLAHVVPELPSALHCKWATLFADRLFETVSKEQIEDLCIDDEKNEASLALLFLLFLESERMEKQVDADIACWQNQGVVSDNIV